MSAWCVKYYQSPYKVGLVVLYISAWASALLVQTDWAMRRPQTVGRVTGTDSRAFFMFCLIRGVYRQINKVMKKIVLIVLGLLLILTSYAQGTYRVEVSSTLNARELPQEHAKVITQLKKGEVVDVVEITDGWAKINYDNRYLYISSKYIRKVESSPIEQDKFSYNGNFLERIKMQIPDTQWMIYPILFLSVILWLLRIKRDDDYLEDGLYITNLICFFYSVH